MEAGLSKRHNGKKRSVHDGDPKLFEDLIHFAENDLAQFILDLKRFKSKPCEDLVFRRVSRV